MPADARVWTLAGLAACAVAGLLIVALGAGFAIPGGDVHVFVPGGIVAVPGLIVVCAYVALALAAAVLAAGSVRRDWRLPVLTRLGVGLVGAAVAAGCAGVAGDLGLHPGAHRTAAVALVALDACVTASLAVLALLWWTRRQGAVEPGTLLVALVVSTLVAHPGVILPAGWRTGLLFYLALVYPPVWQFLFDAETLNEPTGNRPVRVLRAIGLAALLLTVALVDVAVEIVAPGAASGPSAFVGSAGRYFVMVPLGALLVAEVAAWRRAEPQGAGVAR